MRFKLTFIAVLFALILLLRFPNLSFASSNFSTSYSITYAINENGVTHATLHGTLTNTSSQYYASSYKIQLGFDDLENVKASDPGGQITPKVTKNEGNYTVALDFNTKSVGIGSKLPFIVTFDTSTVAKKSGKVWEINIPGIANPDDFSDFSVNVNVPPSFGKPSYIKPAQPNDNLVFSKDQLGNSGISITFGNEQLYSFSLYYHLKNDNIYPIRTEIALPPSTNYQEVFLTSISPEPVNVTEDADGNWLAEYRLLPAELLKVTATGAVRVRLIPKTEILSPKDYQEYLKDKPYWEVSKNEIQSLARKLKTPKNIYDHVAKTLSYDFSRVTAEKSRLGAYNLLKDPSSAVCREFTDLFIALSRAVGIPAREINGFAYTENSKQRPLSLVRDVLHAWPEYYDSNKKTWIMVDPTWGNTTGGVDYFNVLDLDHFAFVIKGRDSDYPVPAGGYKLIDDKSSRDIEVNFTEGLAPEKKDILITSAFEEYYIAGLPITGEVTLKNTGTQKIKPQVFLITSKTLAPNQQTITTFGIPPFGHQTWRVKFYPSAFLTNTNATFTIQSTSDSDLGEKQATQNIKIVPFFLTLWGLGGVIFGSIGVILFIIAFKTRRLRLPRQ